MKKNDIKVGSLYVAKVTGKLARIRIDAEDPNGGWDATNLETNRRVRIKSARRLRHDADSASSTAQRKATPTPPPVCTTMSGNDDINAKADSVNNTDRRRLSALDAAAAVLMDSPTPMRCGELITTMAARDLWASPNGKTPQATLNSALIREIRRKGNQSRFRRCGRGMFKLNKGCEPAGAASN